MADYPIMIDPVVRGKFSGAVVFTAEIRSGFIRCSVLNVHVHVCNVPNTKFSWKYFIMFM